MIKHRLFRVVASVTLNALIAMPGAVSSQDLESQRYGSDISSHLGPTYTQQYWDLIQKGWEPLKAHGAIWAYSNGWKLGYDHGWHDEAYQIRFYAKHRAHWTKLWMSWFDQEYDVWLKFHQEADWSKDVWGAYEKGYVDGEDRGRVQSRKDRDRRGFFYRDSVPAPDKDDFGRAARNAGSAGDAGDSMRGHWPRRTITGPGSF
jgi:hypothetical protein